MSSTILLSFVLSVYGTGDLASCGCCSCERACGPSVCAIKFGRSTCDLVPHTPYFPELHGWYYFRPYHHADVAKHKDIAQKWGMDPRTPYRTDLFRKIYEELTPANAKR